MLSTADSRGLYPFKQIQQRQDGLCSRRCIECPVNIRQMKLHCVYGNPKAESNLTVAFSANQQPNHLPFPFGESGGYGANKSFPACAGTFRWIKKRALLTACPASL